MSGDARGRVVVTDCDHPSLDVERGVLEGAGFELVPRQLRSAEELIAACGDAEVLLNQYTPLTEAVLAALPRLRAVVR